MTHLIPRNYGGILRTSSRHYRLIRHENRKQASTESRGRPLQSFLFRSHEKHTNFHARYHGSTRGEKQQRSRWQQHRLLQHEDVKTATTAYCLETSLIRYQCLSRTITFHQPD